MIHFPFIHNWASLLKAGVSSADITTLGRNVLIPVGRNPWSIGLTKVVILSYFLRESQAMVQGRQGLNVNDFSV